MWRPTSYDAIRLMWEGVARGKGLNVKAKSAKGGKLSGLVPFVQIHNEADKRRVSTCHRSATVRVYYATPAARQSALDQLSPVLAEMSATSESAVATLAREKATGEALPDEVRAHPLFTSSLHGAPHPRTHPRPTERKPH